MSARSCPVCGQARSFTLLERQGVPVHQNQIMGSLEEAEAAARGDLEIVCCPDCGFAHNRRFAPSLLSYQDRYENTQTCSPSFVRYIEERVERLVAEEGVRGKRIVEIGCGQGDFLRRLVRADDGNRCLGYDPAYRGPSEELGGRLCFVPRPFGADVPLLEADIVICRHLIEHLPDPLAFLEAVKRATDAEERLLLFFETPSLEWILEREVIWDLYYEHCSYYSRPALQTLFSRAGLALRLLEPAFEGQYFWIRAEPGVSSPREPEPDFLDRARSFTRRLDAHVGRWQRNLRTWRRKGRLAVWGAGAKGVTFVNLIDPQRRWIDCLVDLNPAKQGHFVPGTGHPIVGVEELGRRGIGAAVLMNPNYRAENESILEKAGLSLAWVE